MLGDVVELSIVVRDLDSAVERFTRLFGLRVHRRSESVEFGFKNAVLPTGIGHIEFLEPTDPTKPVARFLEKHGEGVYLVGFEVKDIPKAVSHLQAHGVRVDYRRPDVAWIHPRDAHGVFVELRKRESYGGVARVTSGRRRGSRPRLRRSPASVSASQRGLGKRRAG